MRARAWLTFAALATATAHGASIEVTVVDASGAPVADAVAFALPKSGGPLALRKRDTQIEQVDKTFLPLVTVVQTGSAISFPNRDVTRHHVYSFSPPKPFELKLYVGTPAAPVVFDKPGEVVLGCNIHDQMVAYILVVDTPHFARTGKDGKARIEGLAPGDFELRLWHYAQALPAAGPRAVKVTREADAIAAAWKLTMRPQPPRPVAR